MDIRGRIKVLRELADAVIYQLDERDIQVFLDWIGDEKTCDQLLK